MVLGGALAVAAVLAALAAVGGLPRLQPLVGLIVILSLAYALSTNRRAIDRTDSGVGAVAADRCSRCSS